MRRRVSEKKIKNAQGKMTPRLAKMATRVEKKKQIKAKKILKKKMYKRRGKMKPARRWRPS
jgi:hypothetical protein